MNNFPATPLPALAVSGLTKQETAIFATLHAAITEQRLLPSARLTEEELADIYEVSRMRIRRVLLALAHTGMIELPPGRGALVARPSAEEARHLFATRQLIEGKLLEAPLAKPTPKRLKALHVIVADESKAAHAENKGAMIQLSAAFHVELAGAYGNPVLAEIISGLATRSSLIIALYQTNIIACCRSDDHAGLLDLLSAGLFDEAGARMRAHLRTIEMSLKFDRPANEKRDLRSILSRGYRPRAS